MHLGDTDVQGGLANLAFAVARNEQHAIELMPRAKVLDEGAAVFAGFAPVLSSTIVLHASVRSIAGRIANDDAVLGGERNGSDDRDWDSNR
jgi:hypothetical protein